MKRLGLIIVAVLALFCACAQQNTSIEGEKDASFSWQEQYDLGIHFLAEGNYEQAIIAFKAAIEIEPKREEAYLGLADAYIGNGELEGARAIIEQGLAVVGESEELTKKLESIVAENGESSESDEGGHTGGDVVPFDEERFLELQSWYRAHCWTRREFDMEGVDYGEEIPTTVGEYGVVYAFDRTHKGGSIEHIELADYGQLPEIPEDIDKYIEFLSKQESFEDSYESGEYTVTYITYFD